MGPILNCRYGPRLAYIIKFFFLYHWLAQWWTYNQIMAKEMKFMGIFCETSDIKSCTLSTNFFFFLNKLSAWSLRHWWRENMLPPLNMHPVKEIVLWIIGIISLASKILMHWNGSRVGRTILSVCVWRRQESRWAPLHLQMAQSSPKGWWEPQGFLTSHWLLPPLHWIFWCVGESESLPWETVVSD